MDLTTRSDLLAPGDDSTEPINPEQWRNDVQDDIDDEGVRHFLSPFYYDLQLMYGVSHSLLSPSNNSLT